MLSLGGGAVRFFAGGDEYRDDGTATDLRLQLRPALLLFGQLANDREDPYFVAGALAGVCAFVCARLWLTERSRN